MNSYAITCGDVNGIGPEIVLKTLNSINLSSKKIIFICPKNIFKNTVKIVQPKFSYSVVKSLPQKISPGKVLVLEIGKASQNYGKPTVSSGKTSYKSILKACELSKEKTVDAIITSPISKLAFQKAKVNFPGHTELLAEYFNVKKYSMMFISNKMIAGLLTIHIPIKSVAKQITKNKLLRILEVVNKSLQKDFKIKNPKIAVLGLNPHAGEKGKIGIEEEQIIYPTLKNITGNVHGPFVSDAYFGNKLYENYDCTIGMYHDQILIPFKLLNFNKGVNFTAGLPIVRTSPDHGTAFDIAGKGKANTGSMIQAFNFAVKIVNNRIKIK